MHLFFVDENQIESEFIRITGADVNHISKVLRLPLQEEILISNRQGLEYCCIIDSIDKDFINCKILSIEESNQELPAKIYLFQGLPKQDKMELIIQKSIELGVYEIVPVAMERSIVKLNSSKKDKKADRWQKIAESAAKQSHRGIIPRVHEPLSFKEAMKYAKELDTIIVPYEKANQAQYSKEVFSKLNNFNSIGIFIGPEGGFAKQEISEIEDLGASIVTLGKRILRTETAGLVVLSIIMFNMEVG